MRALSRIVIPAKAGIQLVALLALLSIGTSASADGSVDFEQADAYLKEAPDLRAYLMDTLCISHNGMAARLSGEYPLGGLRVGPYEFPARPKRDSKSHLMLRVNTVAELFDEKGQPIIGTYGDPQPWSKAYSVKEHFASVELLPARHWSDGLKAVNCDETL